MTFGGHDDTAAKFYDDHTIVFTSTADRSQRRRSRPRSLRTATSRTSGRWISTDGQLRQWTDTATGNVSPVVLRQARRAEGRRSSRTTRVETASTLITGDKPIATVDVRAISARPVPMIDFRPPISHTLMRDNIHKKGAFEKMSAGRPAAGQPRRHERRQLLRQHRDHVHRRARATSRSTSSSSRCRSTGRSRSRT